MAEIIAKWHSDIEQTCVHAKDIKIAFWRGNEVFYKVNGAIFRMRFFKKNAVGLTNLCQLVKTGSKRYVNLLFSINYDQLMLMQ